MLTPQFLLPIAAELVVDLFAGGGGASTGIEQAIGRPVDIAVNHDAAAVALHQANHPQTLHFVSDVFEVDPLVVTDGQPVGLLWASPDCKHFSKAKGGKPVSKRVRGLAWVVVKWAKLVRPRVICLENVEEFQTWGPLAADGRPCPERKGRTFKRWMGQLQSLGYRVEWRELRACDYGAPTIRKRLFLVARCDGMPIVWPEATHAAKPAKGSGLKPWRTAAECIDWSLPCPSIFERERPLADATLRRIAHGVMRYVINAATPYIVRIGQTGHGDGGKVRSTEAPLSTITTKAEHLLCTPTLVQTGYGERAGQAPRVPGLDKPLGTVVAGAAKHALVAAFLAKHYTGVVGSDLEDPIGTVTATDHHSLVASNLVKLRGTSNSAATDEPLHTISAGGQHHAEVRAMLTKYYGTGDGQGVDEPLHTVTTKPRFGLVTVAGEQYSIADIGMRMLQPRELYNAQGFPHFKESRIFRACLVSQSSSSMRVTHVESCSPDARSSDRIGAAVAYARIGFGQLHLEIRNAERSLSSVHSAGRASSSPLPIAIDDIARRLARRLPSAAQDLRTGKEASPARGESSTRRRSGAQSACQFGNATMPRAADVADAMPTATGGTKSTTSRVGRGTQNTDLLWQTLFSFVARAIASSIQGETQKDCSFDVEVHVEDGYIIDRGADGRVLPKDAQVRMCGNSVSPPVAASIVRANYAEHQALRAAA